MCAPSVIQAALAGMSRRDALLEWVRRGGKLVVSVGSNASNVAPSELFQDVLPARIKSDPPSRDVAELPLRWQTTGVGPTTQPLAPKKEGDKFAGTMSAPSSAPTPSRI